MRMCVRELGADISENVFSFWKWQVMDRISQTMPPPTTRSLFVRCTCLLDSFQPCLFLLHSIPKSIFSLDCLSLINLMLNLETYFSKSPGLKRERTTDKMAFLIHVYHLLFISLTMVKLSQKFPLRSLLSSCRSHNFFFFPVLQLNVTGHI